MQFQDIVNSYRYDTVNQSIMTIHALHSASRFTYIYIYTVRMYLTWTLNILESRESDNTDLLLHMGMGQLMLVSQGLDRLNRFGLAREPVFFSFLPGFFFFLLLFPCPPSIFANATDHAHA